MGKLVKTFVVFWVMFVASSVAAQQLTFRENYKGISVRAEYMSSSVKRLLHSMELNQEERALLHVEAWQFYVKVDSLLGRRILSYSDSGRAKIDELIWDQFDFFLVRCEELFGPERVRSWRPRFYKKLRELGVEMDLESER